MIKRIATVFFMVFLATALFAAQGKFVLVIDAGHGGRDAGARGHYSLEKNINLKVALAFGRYVEKNCSDVKVIYTRKTDVFVPLHERANIANKNHADVFISIHTNAIEGSRKLRGFETYTMGMRRSDEKLSAAQRENSVITIEDNYQQRYAGYDPSSPESEIMFEFIHDKNMEQSVNLAKLVQKNVCSLAGRPNKGVKQDVFLVLRETSMPACLIELGYITTPEEERLLNNNATIDRIAYGIFSAFVKYKDKNNAVIPPYALLQKPSAEKSGDRKEDGEVSKSKEEKRKAMETVTSRAAAIDNNDSQPFESAGNGAANSRKEVEEQGVDSRKKVQRDTVGEKNDRKNVTNNEGSEKTGNTNSGRDRKRDAASSEQQHEDAPVFKVQFLTGPRVLREGAREFKGLKGVTHYRDGSTVKFTVGEYPSFKEASAKKREIQKKFPDAFVVAIYNGQRIDINEARRWKKK